MANSAKSIAHPQITQIFAECIEHGAPFKPAKPFASGNFNGASIAQGAEGIEERGKGKWERGKRRDCYL
jgi:hypothetical protein